MARDFNGSSSRLQGSQNLSAYSALCVGFWAWADTWHTSSSFDMLVELTADGAATSGGFAVYQSGGTGSSVGMSIAHRGGSGASAATYGSSARPSTGAWHHYLFTGDFALSTNEVNFYLDGVLQTSAARAINANNASGSVYANSNLNVGSRNAASLWFDGKIAELGIWNAASTDAADIAAQLAIGASPASVLPASLVRYWRLIGRESPEPDLRGGTTLTVTGATQADHPRVYYPGRRRTVFVPGAGGSPISGDAAISLAPVSLTASGTVDIKAASSVTLASAVLTATGTVALTAAASITLASVSLTATGAVDVKAGAALTLFGVELTATGSVAITGSSALTLASVSLTAAGSVDIKATAAIALSVVSLTATGAVALTGDASISLAGVTLTATGSVSVTASAAIALAGVALTGTGAVTVSGSGAITLAGISLAADSIVTSGTIGSAAISLAPVSLVVSGSLDATGIVSVFLAPIGLAATATFAEPIEIAGHWTRTIWSRTVERDKWARTFGRSNWSRTWEYQPVSGSSTLNTVEVIEKGISEDRDFGFDLTDCPEIATGSGITIASAVIANYSDLTVGAAAANAAEFDGIAIGYAVVVRISGGTINTTYRLVCKVTLSNGRKVNVAGRLRVTTDHQ